MRLRRPGARSGHHPCAQPIAAPGAWGHAVPHAHRQRLTMLELSLERRARRAQLGAQIFSAGAHRTGSITQSMRAVMSQSESINVKRESSCAQTAAGAGAVVQKMSPTSNLINDNARALRAHVHDPAKRCSRKKGPCQDDCYSRNLAVLGWRAWCERRCEQTDFTKVLSKPETLLLGRRTIAFASAAAPSDRTRQRIGFSIYALPCE